MNINSGSSKPKSLMKLIATFILFITALPLYSQVMPREFEFNYIIKYKSSKVVAMNTKEQLFSIKLGVLYRIYSLKDSLVYEPSYPWHRKTLMVYHINDYDRLIKIDTNLPRYNKWIDLKKKKKVGKEVLHKYALPLDPLKYYKNAPDSVYIWVTHNPKPDRNWVSQTIKLFKVLDGVPENSLLYSVVYGSTEIKMTDLELSQETLKFTDDGMYTTIEQMEKHARNGRPRD